MISHHSVQKVLDATNVVDVISDFIQLKQRGANQLGLCPFHSEKTPSFTVSPSKNIYKCFGCGKAGNAVTFLMEHEKLNFPESIRYLAKLYNIELEETESTDEQKEIQSIRDSLFVITDRALAFYKDQLDTPQGKSVARAYFKKRGFLQKTIDKFGLGYAADHKDAFTSLAVTEGYNIELLRKTGLTTKFDNDFFRSRIIFPIFSLSGKVIAFAGRTMNQNPNVPKYINSPETYIYEKRKILYGLNLAKTSIQKEGFCILVEGYTDVISLSQSGIENVVASSGTALTVDQIRLIKRYTDTIYVLFDGDQAGVAAATKGINLILGQDLSVKIILLPADHDPDSYIQALGANAFRTYINDAAKDFILYRANQLAADTTSDPIKKSKGIEDIILSISMITAPVKRAIYVKECSQILGIDEKTIINTLNKKIHNKLKQEQKKALRAERQKSQSTDDLRPDGQPETPDKPYLYYQERDIIRIIIMYGHLPYANHSTKTVNHYILEYLNNDLISSIQDPMAKQILTELKSKIDQNQNISEHYWVGHPNPTIATLAANICSSPYRYSENWAKMWKIYLQMQPMPEQNVTKDVQESIDRFLLKFYKQLSRENLARIKSSNQQPELVLQYLNVQQKINQNIKSLADALGTVVL